MRSTARTRSNHGGRSHDAVAAPVPTSRKGTGVLFAALAATCAVAALVVPGPARAADEPLEVTLRNLDGEGVGTATFRELPGGGVHIDAMLDALPTGVHGFHLHETGTCDAEEGFESAGGHIADGRSHGFLVEGGPHPGDMPNVHVPDSGSLRVEVVDMSVSLDGRDGQADAAGRLTLLDADGTALMIHSGADDYTSQPSGAAGERIACGVLGEP